MVVISVIIGVLFVSELKESSTEVKYTLLTALHILKFNLSYVSPNPKFMFLLTFYATTFCMHVHCRKTTSQSKPPNSPCSCILENLVHQCIYYYCCCYKCSYIVASYLTYITTVHVSIPSEVGDCTPRSVLLI